MQVIQKFMEIVFTTQFTEKISDFIGLTNNDSDDEPIKFSLIVVGVLDSQRKHNTGS